MSEYSWAPSLSHECWVSRISAFPPRSRPRRRIVVALKSLGNSWVLRSGGLPALHLTNSQTKLKPHRSQSLRLYNALTDPPTTTMFSNYTTTSPPIVQNSVYGILHQTDLTLGVKFSSLDPVLAEFMHHQLEIPCGLATGFPYTPYTPSPLIGISANLRTQCSGAFVIPASAPDPDPGFAGIQRITYE